MKMLRFICLVLVILMTMPLIISCSTEQEERETLEILENSNIEPNSEEALLKPADKDYGGYELKILAETNFLYGYQFTYDFDELGYPTTAINKAVYERQIVMNNVYGIDVVLVSEGDPRTKLDAAFASGTYTYDVASMTGRNLLTAAQKGQFYNINNLEGLNLSASYYDQNIQEQYRLGKRLFTIDGDFSYIGNLYTNCVAYNVDLYNKYGYNEKYGSPYDLVAQKKWTYDVMYEMYKGVGDDLNGDGIYDYRDQYGMISETTIPYDILYGAGVFPVTNVNGELTIALEDPTVKEQTINILQRVMPTVYESSFLQYDKSGWSDGSTVEALQKGASDMFANGRALFRMSSLWAATDQIARDVNYGMLPIPLYYEDQENYYSRCHPQYDGPVGFVNNAQPDIDLAVEVFEIFAYVSKYMPEGLSSMHEAFYETLSEFRLCKTYEDTEIMKIIYENKVYDIDNALALCNVRGIVWNLVWYDNLTALSSNIDKTIKDNKYAFLLLNMALDENCPN
ncbi:MAG: extracellular solute-binding protein [Clostridia bacterium]|nr:extracellular solute-binding protein [Clostridia bacterium]